jgi:hypothetical protein
VLLVHVQRAEMMLAQQPLQQPPQIPDCAAGFAFKPQYEDQSGFGAATDQWRALGGQSGQ